MTTEEKYMARCIELARLGAGHAAPNPMVGCVIIHNNTIIGEGYHQKHGQAHAEVNAINSVTNEDLLKESTIYVSLEPCAHYGLTPPCSDLIIRKEIPRVVIGSIDPFAKVAGKGIEKLLNAGVDVKTGVLKKECDELNKRFFTFHQKKRPYIILKWAQTTDGFIDIDRNEENYGQPTWITGPSALLRVHQMRAEEDAIMVGTNTAEKDNPSLTVRLIKGKNPLRIVLDRELRLDKNLNLFDNSTETLVFNAIENQVDKKTEYIKVDFQNELLQQILATLHSKNKLSLIVEGGLQLLESFISAGLWDEAHVFIGDKTFGSGIKAPVLPQIADSSELIENDRLTIFKNPANEKPVSDHRE
ncbi:bifunctional diaminohydroxyphosphoribosylaminopyrimidine deaminase/5-amino-6-(5-phosphoribosylamino)uracil reductase RibD [Draconibacterium sp. IB214405]|uniref:bifunctional diaminohydroxyphosphoribosylaminopyrimidine deaminase/5-amino-6-(5-phosphoribosylamino)uracil reductase RibD n=1 Tax=Draconibacterium sp. IB214405 TaxID=3097352 RepID=UPI002A1731E2|nr:bifunctional diaminohydroxyphosphoribosylaminopyrimidine deaminase/5-amino-6-(5-phosphoribosylamino)uracil reductase RibD [Draconibacterium sp. IB214405]MDX8341331.1 bifunctional diaminohydroxyphosphoribosylaminopyrimidine deaminase/5-amino-6-(5-phosphoribosylamino)uracil reductase RibD [Draconibacterium sp. IB214405]